MKFIDQGFQKLQHEQDRQTETDATERITTGAYATLMFCCAICRRQHVRLYITLRITKLFNIISIHNTCLIMDGKSGFYPPSKQLRSPPPKANLRLA